MAQYEKYVNILTCIMCGNAFSNYVIQSVVWKYILSTNSTNKDKIELSETATYKNRLNRWWEMGIVMGVA